MADEPQVPVTETPETPAPAAEVVPPDPKDERIKELTEKVQRYENLVVTPEYAQFLAQRQAQAAGKPKREYSEADKTAFMEKLNNMSRAEFAQFVRDLTVETVKEQMFQPIVSSLVTDRVKEQIAVAQQKYPDFLDYRPEMIAISNANPSLNAEQVYLLAKGQRGSASQPTAAGKPPVRKPSGETPSGTPATRTEKTPEGFISAFDAAFKKAGL